MPNQTIIDRTNDYINNGSNSNFTDASGDIVLGYTFTQAQLVNLITGSPQEELAIFFGLNNGLIEIMLGPINSVGNVNSDDVINGTPYFDNLTIDNFTHPLVTVPAEIDPITANGMIHDYHLGIRGQNPPFSIMHYDSTKGKIRGYRLDISDIINLDSSRIPNHKLIVIISSRNRINFNSPNLVSYHISLISGWVDNNGTVIANRMRDWAQPCPDACYNVI